MLHVKATGLAATLRDEPLGGSTGGASMDARGGNTWKLLQQVGNKLENGRGCIFPHPIDAKVAALAVAAKTDLEEGVRLSPDRCMNGYPSLTGSTLVTDPQVAWLDFIAWHVPPRDPLSRRYLRGAFPLLVRSEIGRCDIPPGWV